jgi:choline dehydrogenase
MRSGVGDPATLETLGIRPAAELPGVGRGLMDHPLGAVLVPCLPPERPTPVFDSMLTWRSPFASAVAAPDVFLAAGGPFSVPSSPTGAAFVVSYAVLRPRSRGWLRLDSGDPYAAPRIHIGHLQDKLDVRRMIAGYHQAVELATSDRMARLGVGPVTAPPPEDGAAVERYVRETSGTFHHPVGTCRMGPDPADGAVVDQHGRVHGVDALLVADASVMPHIPSAPTHLATIAVAERIAEWLSH